MSRAALFVIDIQYALAGDRNTEVQHAQRILTAGTALLASARHRIDSVRSKGEILGLEIVVVQHEETSEKGNLQRGSKEWEVVFPPREGDEYEALVSKDVRDTFQSNPGLANQLRERNIDTIVVFGIQSECCVQATARGALAAGFKVVLLSGAHSTYDRDGKTAVDIEREVEDALSREGVVVTAWEEWTQ